VSVLNERTGLVPRAPSAPHQRREALARRAVGAETPDGHCPQLQRQPLDDQPPVIDPVGGAVQNLGVDFFGPGRGQPLRTRLVNFQPPGGMAPGPIDSHRNVIDGTGT
jgi:hypothetical protein